jgi:adenine-specific DNA-methyltransferase
MRRGTRNIHHSLAHRMMEVEPIKTELDETQPMDPGLDGTSLDIAAEKRRELLELFPELRIGGDQIDFERLRLAVGESVDVGKERYGLTWPGKSECFNTIQAASMATLLPLPEKSIDFDTTENLIIEGDNLEVLKLLQKSYLGKVKMIYIDPPYNTGNDLIYPDDYSESLQTYLQYTGQVDPEGKKFGTNTDADGRFHSKWLNMMYPRLYLARSLLKEDGVIFVSIDDTEVASLRLLMNEIFGEDRFCGVIKRRAARKTAFLSKSMSDVCDYIMIYSRGELSQVLSVSFVSDNTRPVFNGGNKVTSRCIRSGTEARCKDGTYGAASYQVRSLAFTLASELVVKGGKTVNDVQVAGPWRINQDVLDKSVFVTRNFGFRRHVLDEEKEAAKALSDLLDDRLYYNEAGTEEVDKLFGTAGVFNNPKPTQLVCYLARAAGVQDDDIVLDFFAGSGTTAQAILDLNAADEGSRKFILVQLPEGTGRSDYPTIADIAEERVRRVIRQLADAGAAKLSLENGGQQDRGFRVFKLAQSNVKEWDASVAHDVEAVEAQLALSVDHLRHDRNDLDIVYEVLLKSGYPLSSRVSTEDIDGKRAHSLANGGFLICLERSLTLALIRAIAARKPERVLLLDEGFAGNDQLKTNAVQTFKEKNVVFRTL